ncbi:MAG: Rha family transcriptional regulator [Clostridium sp.]|uniref:Rha family transcriptional regulator n=1 Tax=Clostridium sp. TaxID=1506 RepID=UPI003EE438E9
MNKVDLFRNMVSINDGEIVTTSRKVADVFGKRHSDVIRKIESIDCYGDFSQRNFASAEYIDEQGKPRKQYYLTKDGMALLVMGFSGRKATEWKINYINAFNWMADKIHQSDELDRELNDFTRRESNSVSAGSFHGRGLAQRRKEKSKLAIELDEIKERIQMVLPVLAAIDG